jgi:chemotaxis protein methyltransferase WspC
LLERAVAAADAGDLTGAIALAAELAELDPLNADAYFVRGLAELGSGDAAAAVGSFRRALFIDPSFGLAAFKLARACDATGDRRSARRAYAQALDTLSDDNRHRAILGQVDVADVADACRARLLSV